ncbi:glycosyltransferase [Kaistella anthropi]|nr:glycosyltransferase [Kaistella anthropi]
MEFIIANDNSPDATDEVVKKYFLENSVPGNFEIKYTKHETNKGMMPNFVWALEQATGEYIALCEGDDYWMTR